MINYSRLILSLFFLSFIIFGYPSYAQNKNSIITITIKLKRKINIISIEKAPLKYNKSFAFSFTLDDGLVSDYLVAYPFFKGGEVGDAYKDQWGYNQGGDELYYPGLYYTDGCGNPVTFKAGIAINAKSIGGADTIFHHGFLTWKQIKMLYNSGWDIFNHGYSHATGKGINEKYEIEKNNEEVKKHFGFEMKDFVVPGGHDDVISNGPYTKLAFDLGMETVQCQCKGFKSYMVNIDSTLSLKHLTLGRLFMHTVGDSVLLLSPGNDPPLKEGETTLFNKINDDLKHKQIFWINAFTHSVGNQNIWNISTVFPEFISFFNQLESKYGQQGADNIWMAPTQEVYEYLLNRKSMKFNVSRKKDEIIISINKNDLPQQVRYHETTFILKGISHIKNVTCNGCNVESYSADKKDNVVNITWQ